jgi:hypothetical protein
MDNGSAARPSPVMGSSAPFAKAGGFGSITIDSWPTAWLTAKAAAPLISHFSCWRGSPEECLQLSICARATRNSQLMYISRRSHIACFRALPERRSTNNWPLR